MPHASADLERRARLVRELVLERHARIVERGAVGGHGLRRVVDVLVAALVIGGQAFRGTMPAVAFALCFAPFLQQTDLAQGRRFRLF